MPFKDPEKERACGRRRYERITADRITRGMCPRCGKARPAPGRTLCRHCGEKRRKTERARCAKAKAAGKQYGGRDQAKRLKDLEKENGRLWKAISDLTLDKLILKEALEGNC